MSKYVNTTAKALLTSTLALMLLTSFAHAEQLVMETRSSRLVIELAGGGITEFRPFKGGINPFTWDSAKGDDKQQETARQRGHFICLDRWGPASEAEASIGMPPHGEASRVNWELTDLPAGTGEQVQQATMQADLPLAGLRIQRTINMDQASSVFHVKESVKNTGKIGRIYNLVQHPSIAAPFLNEATVVTCNATRGFPQSSDLADPEIMVSDWPMGLKPDGSVADIRRLTNDDVPGVMSYIFEEKIGWIAAYDPKSSSILGYLWNQRDYPWINLWRRVQDKEPVARGLEFGTTGLHRTYDELVRKGIILDRRLFRYIDCGEVQTFDYICFLAAVPTGYREVADIRIGNGSITVIDINQRAHQLPVNISLLLP